MCILEFHYFHVVMLGMHSIFVGTPEEKRPVGRPRRFWKGERIILKGIL
jgi:hypothetical protein